MPPLQVDFTIHRPSSSLELSPLPSSTRCDLSWLDEELHTHEGVNKYGEDQSKANSRHGISVSYSDSDGPSRKKRCMSNEPSTSYHRNVSASYQPADRITATGPQSEYDHVERENSLESSTAKRMSDDEVVDSVETTSEIQNSHNSNSDSDSEGEEIQRSGKTTESKSEQAAAFSDPKSEKTRRRELFDVTQHRSLVKSLKTELITLQPSLNPKKLEGLLDMIDALEDKYKKATDWAPKKKLKTVPHPSTREHFIKRFQGKGTEEAKHPWLPKPELDPDIPEILMRAWDEISQCQVRDYRVGCLSGSSACMLDTFEARKLALTRHADWGNRFKTPFISSSSSLDEIANARVPHFQQRQIKKGIKDNTKLTLFNTRARHALGKPVLRMMKELLYHNAKTKYGDPIYVAGSFFDNEYLLPFSAGPAEIIGTWAWHQVEDWIKKNNSSFDGWFAQVGVPAFKEHERLRNAK